MKGVVFDVVLDTVEAEHGLARREALLESIASHSGGAYTSVGTYDDAEMVAMVVELARQNGADVRTTLRALGRSAFLRLLERYPALPPTLHGTFAMARGLESIIHAEVRKLYPDSRPPRFSCEDRGPDELRVTYRSPRALADLAVGLFEGCAMHFGESIAVELRFLKDDGSEAEITLRRRDAPDE